MTTPNVSQWTATLYKLEYGREKKQKSCKFFASNYHTQRWRTTLAKRGLGVSSVDSTTAHISPDEFVIKMKSLGAFIECKRGKGTEVSLPDQLDEPGLVMGVDQ